MTPRADEKIIIYCLIFAVVLALPARDSKGEGEYPQRSIQELTGNHYARARNYYHKGEYSKAKVEFQEVLKLAPEHQGARWYLKCAEKELAKYRNRKTFWGRREKLKEKGKPAREKARHEQPERQEGKEVRLKAEEKEKEELEKIKQFYEKGKMYFQRGLYPEAMACFEKVIESGENP